MKTKIFSKAAAVLAVGAIVTGLSGAMAVPASAVDMNYSVGKNSAMRYTVYTTKISNTQVKLTFKVVNNPGITGLQLCVVDDGNSSYTKMDNAAGVNAMAVYNDTTNLLHIVYLTSNSNKNGTTGELELSVIYTIKNKNADSKFNLGVTSYQSFNEPNASFTEDFNGTYDATVSVSPTQYVKLGDVDCNGTIDSTDIFYLRQMVLEATNNKLSTTYLDRQLKNTNSSWYKSYSFIKCAAVADINHDEWIQNDDADALMLYVAQKGAGAAISNKEISTLFPVTVVYDN